MSKWIDNVKAYFGDRQHEAESDPTSLGNIALEHGFVTKETLSQALEFQIEHVPKLGEILVHMGTMTPFQLQELLLEQARLRAKTALDHSFVKLQHQRTSLKSRLDELQNDTNRLVNSLKEAK